MGIIAIPVFIGMISAALSSSKIKNKSTRMRIISIKEANSNRKSRIKN